MVGKRFTVDGAAEDESEQLPLAPSAIEAVDELGQVARKFRWRRSARCFCPASSPSALKWHGGIAILRIVFVPEPQRWLMLVAGLSVLGVLYRIRGR